MYFGGKIKTEPAITAAQNGYHGDAGSLATGPGKSALWGRHIHFQ